MNEGVVIEILEGYAAGLTDRQIARRLYVSRSHAQRKAATLRKELGAKSRPHAVALAIRRGYIR